MIFFFFEDIVKLLRNTDPWHKLSASCFEKKKSPRPHEVLQTLSHLSYNNCSRFRKLLRSCHGSRGRGRVESWSIRLTSLFLSYNSQRSRSASGKQQWCYGINRPTITVTLTAGCIRVDLGRLLSVKISPFWQKTTFRLVVRTYAAVILPLALTLLLHAYRICRLLLTFWPSRNVLRVSVLFILASHEQRQHTGNSISDSSTQTTATFVRNTPLQRDNNWPSVGCVKSRRAATVNTTPRMKAAFSTITCYQFSDGWF